jgi:lysophospholipase L1-like esterase
MIAKVLVFLLALIIGGWMIFDGAYVLSTGKYFGAKKPGVWSNVVSAFGVNPLTSTYLTHLGYY